MKYSCESCNKDMVISKTVEGNIPEIMPCPFCGGLTHFINSYDIEPKFEFYKPETNAEIKKLCSSRKQFDIISRYVRQGNLLIKPLIGETDEDLH